MFCGLRALRFVGDDFLVLSYSTSPEGITRTVHHFIFSCLKVQRERSSPSRNATQVVPKIKPGLTVRVAFITVLISQAVLYIHLHLPHLRV